MTFLENLGMKYIPTLTSLDFGWITFLENLGMKYIPTLTSLDFGWILFYFLYSRFGLKDSYHFLKYCMNAFVITLLGSIVFSLKRNKKD